jgi:ferredoxin
MRIRKAAGCLLKLPATSVAATRTFVLREEVIGVRRDGMFAVAKDQLDPLICELAHDGYTVIGPTIRDGAITYDEITSAAMLPRGWTQETDGGHYRLKRRTDDACFGFVVGPHSLKRYLFPSRLKLFSVTRDGQGGFSPDVEPPPAPKYAFVGVRSCDLAAVAVQDMVFNSEMPDPYYRQVREQMFVVAVNCAEPGGTCFCSSMDTGPRCSAGYDLAITELSTSFAMEVGSERGQAMLERVRHEEADANARHLVDLMMSTAAKHNMGRSLDTADLPEILMSNLEHRQWDQAGNRCLACANCTLVCPTCFCNNIYDRTDLSGDHADRYRNWGSCFALEFTYHTGGYIRSSRRARYRQWLTHKLASWHGQFGTSGCVGCGRCITWCPVGIDITVEATAIADDVRESLKRHGSGTKTEEADV